MEDPVLSKYHPMRLPDALARSSQLRRCISCTKRSTMPHELTIRVSRGVWLSEDEMLIAVSLGFETKYDLHSALTAEATDKLSLHSWRRRQWCIRPVCAITGNKPHDGLDCLLSSTSRRRQKPQTLRLRREARVGGGTPCGPEHGPHHRRHRCYWTN